jgi:hypothetical protein
VHAEQRLEQGRQVKMQLYKMQIVSSLQAQLSPTTLLQSSPLSIKLFLEELSPNHLQAQLKEELAPTHL